MKQDLRRGVIVALTFTAFVGLSVLVISFKSHGPTAQQACTQRCSDGKKAGYLVYRGPATPKDSYKAAHSECECR